MQRVGILVRIRLVRHHTMVIALPMSFKLNFKPTESFALPNHAVIRISGPHAKTFLQSQCMNDVNVLAERRWQYNGWLNPQGRVMALFYLLALNDSDFFLILPALPAESLIGALSRYRFRAKVTISTECNQHVTGRIHESKNAADDAQQTGIIGGFCIAPCAAGLWRSVWITQYPSATNPIALDTWHSLDMMRGWPWINESQQGLWTPHMLGLQALDAFSVKKGCYPGQEIVARTHFLGKNKRTLYVVNGDGLVEGATLFGSGNEIGKVIDANLLGTLGLSVLPIEIPLDAIHNYNGPVSLAIPQVC